MFEVGVEDIEARKDFNKSEEVFLHEEKTDLLEICDFSRGIEDGSREGESYKKIPSPKYVYEVRIFHVLASFYIKFV
jgi:hypothetical protein